LWTFVLDGDPAIEPVHGIARPALTRIDFDDAPDTLARGADQYARRCVMCHGGGASSGGAIADLRYSTEATYRIFQSIVRDGAYTSLGMPNLGSIVTAVEADAIRNYLLSLRAGLIEY
jgi:mono/diheme cytochrome c family protein